MQQLNLVEKIENYINSITCNNYKMAHTETVPTKFPKHDIRIMDKLIQKGIFISRSDLIRKATREKIQQSLQVKTYGDVLVQKMEKEEDFDNIEWKTLVNIYFNPRFAPINEAEKKALKKLLRDPLGLIKKQKEKLIITKNGESIIKGYLKALLHSKTS